MLLENIFHHLFFNEKFYNIVYPYLFKELFTDKQFKILFQEMKKYTDAYSKRPSPKDIKVLLDSEQLITESETEELQSLLKKITTLEATENTDFILDETEKFVQNRTMEMAILESVEILEKNQPRGLIEEKVRKALSISFKNELGLQYFIDAVKQFKFYTAEDECFSCDIEDINEAVGGGFRRKAIYLFIGKTNVGKTLWLCHLAASFLRNGYNTVYFTAEMSEHAITKRIDSNMLNMQMGDLGKNLIKSEYLTHVQTTYKSQKHGKLFVKEYPTGYGSRTNIMSYLQELKLKHNLKPDIIIADYVNIFASSRLPASAASDSYRYMKAVIEEFRATAVEQDACLVSATQLNREFASKSVDKMDVEGTSDSWAIPGTVDWMGVIIQPQELYEASRYLLKNIKTRFEENLYEVWTVGVDRKHMRLLQLDKDEQEIPIHVKDRMKSGDIQREAEASDDEEVRIFDFEVD